MPIFAGLIRKNSKGNYWSISDASHGMRLRDILLSKIAGGWQRINSKPRQVVNAPIAKHQRVWWPMGMWNITDPKAHTGGSPTAMTII